MFCAVLGIGMFFYIGFVDKWGRVRGIRNEEALIAR